MIDFVKVALDRDTAKRLLNNPGFDFKCKVSEQTGEVLPFPKIATLQNLTFKIKSENYCELSGSLHKYAHGGVNHTDFSFADLVDAIFRLQDVFGIDLERARLKNLEIGINLTELVVTPPEFIRSVLTHKGKAFNEMRNYYGRSIGMERYHQRYGLKIYDKGKQYSLPYPVLRFEIKYTRMHDLNKLGLVNLSQLVNTGVLAKIGKELARRFDELLVIDPFLRLEDLRVSERRNLPHYLNPKYWENLKEEDPKKHDYRRGQYRKMIKRYVANPMQQQVLATLTEKVNQLSQVDEKTLAKLTDLREPNLSQSNPSCKELLLPARSSENLIKISIENTGKRETDRKSNSSKKCKITGRDISKQRAGSKFVSAKEVGYRAAHSVRNRDSNPRNSLRYKVNRLKKEYINSLFPLEDVLRLSDEQKEMLSYWQGTAYEVGFDRQRKQ